jgi:hypothetical protein
VSEPHSVESDELRLEDYLTNFFAAEERELSCEKCGDKSALAKVLTSALDTENHMVGINFYIFVLIMWQVSTSLVEPPEVLLIHLKRFYFNKRY